MRKIVLGCAAVLLSLGLLAGCNNDTDSAVTISVDNTATVVVGETLALPYTVEPEKAKVEALSDHEEYVTASAKDGVLSLEGVAAGSATITLVGTYKKYTEANVNIDVSVVTEATEKTEPGTPETGGSGSGYYFGFESDDVLYYITGGTQSQGDYRGEVTTDISEAVEVTFEVDTEVENAYYISFEYEEVEHWITIVTGNYTNLSYATEKAPIYLHTDGEAEYFGNESGDYFLCYNATYGCLYTSKVSDYIASSPVAGIYTASGELVAGGVGQTPEPLPVIDPDDLEEVETGKLGLYQGGKGDYYYFTGTINSSGFGVLSTSWDAGVSVTELTDEEYVVLRIGEEGSYQYIGAKDVTASGVALYDEPYALTYDEDHEAFLTAYGERFIGTYSTYETLSWSDAEKYLGEEGQYVAQLYTEEQHLPAPTSENITISGPTSVYVDSTITLTATVDAGYDQSIIWSTEDEYATVDASTGVVTGVAVGTATIKATSGADSSAYATYDVEVVALPTGVSLLGSFDFSSHTTTGATQIQSSSALDTYWTGESSIYLGAREYNSVYLGGDGGGYPSNESGCIKFGTSSTSGSIQLKFAVGTSITQVVLTAFAWNKGSGIESSDLTVNGITQACSTGSEPEELTYDITDEWTYLLTMESSARCTVHSISIYGTYDSSVNTTIESLTLTAEIPDEGLAIGETAQINVSWGPETTLFDIDELTWVSEDSDVATVTQNLDGAEVHAYSAGTTKITATSSNNVTGEISVTVHALNEEGLYGMYDFSKLSCSSSTSELSTTALATDLNTAWTGAGDPENSNPLSSVDTATKIYDYNSSSGWKSGKESYDGYLKTGGSGNKGEMKITLTQSIVKVVISCHSWNANSSADTVSVNSSATQNASISDSYEDLTFEITSSTVLDFVFTNRVFVGSIKLYTA